MSSSHATAHTRHPIESRAIRNHYDRLSSLYQRFWGEHIHHGWWEDGESLPEAQEKLVRRLAEAAAIPRNSQVLDVGCGLGGSSRWLARELACSVRGITLSPVQVKIATRRARESELDTRVHFERADAEQIALEPESYDVVWSIECIEHLFDKRRFFMRAAQALKPGGSFAICTWLGTPESPEHRAIVDQVCRGMLCPSLGSLEDHVNWFQAAGLEVIRAEDVTANVARTWDLARAVLDRPEVRALLAVSDRETRDFARAFTSMSDAYASGAMGYGFFVARKPGCLPDAARATM
ncbi:MAG: class I SAM-dependent methyltransferase [Opitutaceae bacterium]